MMSGPVPAALCGRILMVRAGYWASAGAARTSPIASAAKSRIAMIMIHLLILEMPPGAVALVPADAFRRPRIASHGRE